MSQSGNLTFFTTVRLSDPQAVLRAVVEFLQPQCIPIIARGTEEEHSWADFLADRDEPDDQMLPSLPGAEGLDRYYREGVVLAAHLDGSPVGLRIGRAVESHLPKEIRGDYAPWDPYIRIGWHDLWECAEHEEGFFFARAFLSIAFFGYFSPSNWKEFRRAIFELPEVRSAKADLERIVGQPLEQVIYWSV